jgi:hypothetical protein
MKTPALRWERAAEEQKFPLISFHIRVVKNPQLGLPTHAREKDEL